jgi:hypothetical protein
MAATRIIAFFNLKPGVAVADYEAWARAVDMPTVKGLGSIGNFQVLRSTAVLGSDAPPPYAYFEIIDVKDMALFGEEVASPLMQKVAAEFGGMVDVTFVMTEPL